MKRLLLLLLLGIFLPLHAYAAINIFACEPEWAALARQIGGRRVDVLTVLAADQSAHHPTIRPSIIEKAKMANLIYCNGAGLEGDWLEKIIATTKKESLKKGNIGYLEAAEKIKLAEVPKDKAEQKHPHGAGNPHFHLDPRNLLVAADELQARLAKLDPENAGEFQQAASFFKEDLSDDIDQWQKQAVSLKGMKLVVGHEAWSYLFNWLGMKQVASLEPSPDVPPSAYHLESLLTLIEKEKPVAIILAPGEDKRPAKWLSEKTGIPIVVLPFTVGGDKKSNNFSAMFSRTIQLLLDANKP